MYIALKELSETPHTQGILKGYLECLREWWCLVVGVWNTLRLLHQELWLVAFTDQELHEQNPQYSLFHIVHCMHLQQQKNHCIPYPVMQHLNQQQLLMLQR